MDDSHSGNWRASRQRRQLFFRIKEIYVQPTPRATKRAKQTFQNSVEFICSQPSLLSCSFIILSCCRKEARRRYLSRCLSPAWWSKIFDTFAASISPNPNKPVKGLLKTVRLCACDQVNVFLGSSSADESLSWRAKVLSDQKANDLRAVSSLYVERGLFALRYISASEAVDWPTAEIFIPSEMQGHIRLIAAPARSWDA